MKDGIDSYLEYSINNLPNITISLEKNIEFQGQTLWTSEEEKKELIKKVIKIYYEKYYLYIENDYTRLEKYLKTSKKINVKLKNILLAIIDYCEENNKVYLLEQNENGCLYLTILIYISIILYNKELIKIDSEEKIKNIIDKIINKFTKINYKKHFNLEELINDIKEIVIKNNKFFRNINKLMNRGNRNSFINISKDTNYYKVMYEYDIEDLDNYDGKDIKIVIKKLNVYDTLSFISFDLLYYTAFKLLANNNNKILLFPIKKELLNKDTLERFIGNKNKKVLQNIKFLIKYNEIQKDYDFVNFAINHNLNLCIDIEEEFESDNYNMFMDVKDVITPEGFLSLNDKYKEIWQDIEMNFIVKNMDTKLSERELLKIK